MEVVLVRGNKLTDMWRVRLCSGGWPHLSAKGSLPVLHHQWH